MVGLGERAILRCKCGCRKNLQVSLNRKNGAMTPKRKGTSPLFKKCALYTLTFRLNPFRATFLFKKAPTKPKKKGGESMIALEPDARSYTRSDRRMCSNKKNNKSILRYAKSSRNT